MGVFTCQLCYDGVDKYKQRISLVIILETFEWKKHNGDWISEL